MPDGEVRKVLHVNQDYVGMLIGKGGANVQAMSRESGAKIDISSRDDEARQATRTVTITGSPEAVEKAVSLVEEVERRSKAYKINEEDEQPSSEAESLPGAPPGFEPCEHEEWLFCADTQEYFHKTKGKLAWLDKSTGMFGPIRAGEAHEDISFIHGACTAPANDATEAKQPAAKTVIIPDLHKVAQALKLPFDHIDRPCSMVAVFGSPATGEGVPVDLVARSLHEKLVRRIASWRSAWLDQAWFGALTGAFYDVATGFNGVQPVVAISLVVGRRAFASSAPGARICFMAGSSVENCLPVTPMEMQGAACCFQMLPTAAPEVEKTLCVPIALIVGGGSAVLEDRNIVSTLAPFAFQGRPRAAAVALAGAVRKAGAKSHLAVAVARLGFSLPKQEAATDDKKLHAEAAKKQAKPDEVLNKVRARQILVRFWSGKGSQPINPLSRKPISRKVDEAEAKMVEVLEKLMKDDCKAWPAVCKASSECQSALKGGVDTGDLGWLDKARAAALAKAKGQPGGPKSAVQSSVPATVLKAAFELEKGQLSDLITSEVGIHLVQRTG